MKSHLKSYSNRVALAVVAMFVSISVAAIQNNTPTSAVSATDFKAGRIIDDVVFYNKDSMSVQQIQDFLNRLIPNCDTWGTGPSEYGGGTRAQYAASRGWPGPPYACLNNYHENPTTHETSFEKGGGAFSGGISAAQIIYNAAQQYGISPKVLLVMLKKESAGPLTADVWPLKTQYKYAMGYACPDSGPGYSANCDSEKSGFYNQMMLAAWQLKYYREHPNDYRYGIGPNSIQYSPDPNCGTGQVYIENMATLSLYIYTPYVPNSGALANYPGTAPCGAYGNRNFFMFFSEWFGTTYGNSQIDMLKADQDIKNTYNAFSSQLGNPTTDITPDFNSVARVWQNFERGTIIWTPGRDAFPILHGSIYDRWRALGGSAGAVGVPLNAAVTEATDGRQWQDFSGGTIIYSASTGAWEIYPGPIGNKWRQSGGSLGTLGKPTSSVIITNSIRKQTFENGVIVRKDINSPAHIMSGSIFETWSGNSSTLGTPTMDAVSEPSDGRIWQLFKQGLVIDDGSGAWIIRYGAVNDKWRTLGGSEGILGKPVSNQTTESDGRIWQLFEGGILIQENAQSPAHPMVYGDIHDRWRDTGGSTGTLGVPRGAPADEADGRKWQLFKTGTVIWSPATGAWEVQGWFYVTWKQYGGSTGSLGKPTGEKQIESDDTRWQMFEHGKITWTPSDGWLVEFN